MPVTKLEIKSREPFAGGQAFGGVGAYEQVDGVVHFSVDPEHPANETIADLKLAPRDGDGRVVFSSDFRVAQPVDPQRGNRRMLLDILNRGKATALRNLNSAPDVLPSDPLDPGQWLSDAAGIFRRLVRLAARRAQCARRPGNEGARRGRRLRADLR